MTAAREIRNAIDSAEPGTVFIPADFRELSSSENIHNVLSRLERTGVLRRCARGVYYKPRFGMLLNEEIPPSIDAISNAIARSNGWTIIPSGNHALNMLGLDTQVPASFTYVSSGPYKEYDIDGAKVSFKHRANRDIIEKSYLTCLFIQALKELGGDGVDEAVLDSLAARFPDEEAEKVYEETFGATSWVFEAAKAIKRAKGL